jgi:hypothetical protein
LDGPSSNPSVEFEASAGIVIPTANATAVEDITANFKVESTEPAIVTPAGIVVDTPAGSTVTVPVSVPVTAAQTMATTAATAEKLKAKKKPGEVTIVNDDKLTKLPDGIVDRSLGTSFFFLFECSNNNKGRNSKLHFSTFGMNTLGFVRYQGPRLSDASSDSASDAQLFLLPKFHSEHLYGTIDVLVPAEHLHFQKNLAIETRAVWGTDVYADDSDVVASMFFNLRHLMITIILTWLG